MIKVLMVASEAAPFAKTGGLADVVGALPAQLREFDCEVAVLIPRYRSVDLNSARRIYDSLPIWLGGSVHHASLYQADAPTPFYFLEAPALYDRDGYYGDSSGDYPDNAVRFAVLARAVLAVARRVFRPQILHCHDWQTGLVPVYLRTVFAHDPTFLGLRTLFTIHNLGYQGLFPPSVLPQIGLDRRVFNMDGLEFFGKVNFMKGGLNFSDALSTVSRRYAAEIQTEEYGFGLDGVLRARSGELHGILNGADYGNWNPETDPHLVAHYSADDLRGKRECKRDLLREFGLPEAAVARPLLGVVSRLTSQKGIELILENVPELVKDKLCLVLLGSGDAEYEEKLREAAAAYPDHIAFRAGYDEALAHKIEAGSDMFLMPSQYEPSGLNQLYSLRYGTVPVVRATGGLDDTIDEGTGFKFQEYSAPALLEAIRAASAVFKDRNAWEAIVRRGMRKDFSWRGSAAEYAALYRRLLDGDKIAASFSQKRNPIQVER
ncbi:MAG TPA: glycogen synthase GlgA [Bryobacteraceae bacterium]|nr:glycogen synthase GlgA [Bryobacteraceae bacterium]